MFGHILCIDSYDDSIIFASKSIRTFGNFFAAEYLPGCVDILLPHLCPEEDNGRLDLLVILVHRVRSASGCDASAELAPHLCVSL
jgi:hypothetical protein